MSYTQIATLIVVGFAVAFFTASFGRIVQILATGKPRNRWNEIPRRLVVFVEEVLLHRKLLRQGAAGFIHLIIFWSFVILTAGTAEWIYHGISGKDFSFLGEIPYRLFCLTQDIFNVFVFSAVAFAFYRRLVVKPKRMADNSSKSMADAYFILSLIWGLSISNLLTHSIGIHNGEDLFAAAKPAANILSNIWFDGPVSGFWHGFFWWSHLAIVLFFLNFLPYSKHFHVILAGPNVWFSKMEPRGRLSRLNLDDTSITSFGAQKVEELPWKNLMDSFACTECGRCNEFCPTTTTGKALRPKSLMINLRAAVSHRGPTLLRANELGVAQLATEDQGILAQDLVPDVYSDQFVWDCTTCGACVEACPVMIDHVDSIVEMRRALVLNKGSNPEEATRVFRNWESASNPWGLNEASRQENLVEQGVPQYQPGADFEFLYYIGCAGSYDDRNKKVVESVVKILQAAGVKFGILGKEERCNGETARRLGNEYLGQQMIMANKEVLEKYQVKKILTSCPHCFNTLKNEYPEFGGHYEVIHHTDYIQKLIADGRLKIEDQSKITDVTYHDSCYIGRYNNIYESPRNIIEAVSGERPIEMPRSKDKGMCCGAGGGRMWLEETTGTRINVNRAEEVIESKAKTVCVACPFCMTMMSDGLKSKGREDIQVKDIAEVVAGAIV